MITDVSNTRLPDFLKRPSSTHKGTVEIKKLLRKSSLNTVCEEARCPNIAECFGRGTATFMILGDICTRGCKFCSVKTGKPIMPQGDFFLEGQRILEAAKSLKLKHVVLTSVARDDLEDGGASGFVHSIRALRKGLPGTTVEVLVPDFRGSTKALDVIIKEEPEVFNHNLETVPRLYRQVRPGAIYQRSLDIFKYVLSESSSRVIIKTGIMLGLGEEESEVKQVFKDAFSSGVKMFTAGQYMRPSRQHLPVKRYLSKEEFEEYRKLAIGFGFKHVAIEPLSRSSYYAERQLESVLSN